LHKRASETLALRPEDFIMPTVPIQEAQARLPDLIHRLTPGEEVVITENGCPVAKLVAPPSTEARKVPKLGTQPGSVLSMEYFDDPLEDFKEYME
jgi:prevent-host-death family protein